MPLMQSSLGAVAGGHYDTRSGLAAADYRRGDIVLCLLLERDKSHKVIVRGADILRSFRVLSECGVRYREYVVAGLRVGNHFVLHGVEHIVRHVAQRQQLFGIALDAQQL